MMTLDLSSTNDNFDGEGVNPEAVTVIDNIFQIANQGTQEVGVWLDINPIENGNGNDAVALYQDSDQSKPIVGQDNAVCLGVGDSVCVGLVARTHGLDSSVENLLESVQGSDTHEMVVNASADAGCNPPLEGSERNLSTGVADWQVTGWPENGEEASPKSAIQIDDTPGAWVDPPSDPNSQWVDPFGTGSLENDPAGEYDYELDFEVNAGSRTLVIDAYSSDNPVDLYLDGDKIGGTDDEEAYSSLRSDIPDQSLLAGDYTLRAEVTNAEGASGNPTGLLVAARLV
jgi:hypothetical protein